MHATRLVSAAALVLLSFVTPAPAVSLDPRGLGEVLIYPYYTVNKNQDTLVSVVNSSGASKAVTMRFREGYNGRVVLDFVLFLSPHDVWTAALSSISDDGGVLFKTSDTSCTDPAIPAAGVAFRSADFDGTGAVPGDGGPTGITRTREGFMEVLAVADIVPGSPTDIAITHEHDGGPGDGTPPGCDTIGTTWPSTSTDVVAPTSGLCGSAAIVNVGQGTFFPYNADALAGFTDIPLNPYMDGGVTLMDTNSGDAVGGVATAYVSDNRGRPLALTYALGIDAASAVFMADAIYNEYIVAGTLGANTDWVVTLPTKAFHTDALYTGAPRPPFTAPVVNGASTVDISGFVYDREEGGGDRFGSGCPGFCPPSSEDVSLSYEVNVVPVENAVTPTGATGVFGSSLTTFSIPPHGDDGQIDMRFDTTTHFLPGGIDPDGRSTSLIGLPVTGFMAYNVINTNAQPGLLANYSGVFHHRSTTQCLGDAPGCTPTISGNGGTP